jgi:hypothetical protein
MPDHRPILKSCLGEMGLAPQREEEILRELGDHVEDHAAALEARGVPQDAAAREALDSVPDWLELRKEILAEENAEEIMNYRTKVLWLPAFCTFLLNGLLLALLQVAGLRPHIYWLNRGLFIPFYIPWLLALPIIGAVGAFWSKRVGGRVSHQLLVSLAPLIIWLGIMMTVFLPLALIVDRRVPLNLKMESLLTYVVAWMLLPSLALSLGALPFLRKPQAQS